MTTKEVKAMIEAALGEMRTSYSIAKHVPIATGERIHDALSAALDFVKQQEPKAAPPETKEQFISWFCRETNMGGEFFDANFSAVNRASPGDRPRWEVVVKGQEQQLKERP